MQRKCYDNKRTVKLEREEGYYLINGKRVLYWNGSEWMESVKDVRGSHGGWIRPLEKQPKMVKSIEKYNTGII